MISPHRTTKPSRGTGVGFGLGSVSYGKFFFGFDPARLSSYGEATVMSYRTLQTSFVSGIPGCPGVSEVKPFLATSPPGNRPFLATSPPGEIARFL